MDQAEFGRRVGVGQQAVSRWERGGSRPTRAVVARVAQALGIPHHEALKAAGYVGAVADSPRELTPPVLPLLPALPFDALGAERFEEACVEVLAYLYPGAHATGFGGSGDKQFGVDLLVDRGATATGQCKRRQRFGPADVRAAIEAVADPAPTNYLFLSRQTATAAARTEMAKHPSWQLWDGSDLSRFVRNDMSAEQSLRFVSTYFPAYRESFLGRPAPGPWQTVEETYASLSGATAFSHRWTLVGRSGERADLIRAIESEESPVTVLLGRGGVGKSRLLRAVAEEFEGRDWEVRFLPPGVELQAADVELLPGDADLLLVVDDTHDRSDVGLFIRLITRHNARVKFLLAGRPYGKLALNRQLDGLGIAEVPEVTLADLPQTAAVALAAEALGPSHRSAADQLAHLTRDCPLATTIGARLIRRGTLVIGRLGQHDDVRARILRGFLDGVFADPAFTDGERRRAVVDAIAVLQPFRSDLPEFREALSALVGVPYDRLAHQLRSLEDSGVLLRRGASLRVVPDLLGDVVLAEACFDQRGQAETGYLGRVLASAGGDALANVFVNIARVDWQVGHGMTDAARPLWEGIDQGLEQGDPSVCLHLLKLVGRVAVFQPGPALEVVEHLLARLAGEPEPSGGAETWQHSWRHVRDEVPAVLRPIAYRVEFLPQAAEVLWDLAQTDTRELHQVPDHPLRILRELAEFQPGKPLEVNEAMLDLAERWLRHDSAISPLSVVESLVATEGRSTEFDGRTVQIRSFVVSLEQTRLLRRRAVELALRELRSPDVRRGVAAAELIGHAVRLPPGHGDAMGWAADFTQTIEAVAEVLPSPELDPVIGIALLNAVSWHAEFGTGTVHAAAQAAQAAAPATTSFDLALTLHDELGDLLPGRRTDLREHDCAVSERAAQVASRVLDELSDERAVQLLEERLRQEHIAFGVRDLHGRRMIAALVDRRPAIALRLLDRVRDESPVTAFTFLLLDLLGRSMPEALLPAVRRLLDHPSPKVRRHAAIGIAGRHRPDGRLLDGELDLLRSFVGEAEPGVRIALIDAACRAFASMPAEASDLLARVPIADAPQVAHHLFMFLTEGSIPWRAFGPDQQAAFLDQLAALPSLDDYWVQRFLRQRSAEDPTRALDLWRGRVELQESGGAPSGFDAVPFHWHFPPDLRGHSAFIPTIRELLVWLGQGGPWRQFLGRDLFVASVGTFDGPVQKLLIEFVRDGGAACIDAVAAALETAPNDLILTEIEFVTALLEEAARLGPEALRRIKSACWGSTVHGVRSRELGQPYPEDVRMRDEGLAIAGRLPNSSIAATFYRELSAGAQRAVDQERHEDLDDGRQW